MLFEVRYLLEVLGYVPVMTPGLYDTFPAHPCHIGWFPGQFMVEIWTF